MQINITYDASLADAPVGFQTAVQAAVQYLENAIATPVTVNIQVGYGEIAGQPMSADALGESEGLGSYYTYDQVRAALAATAVSPDDLAALASLPAADPTHGGDFFVTSAQAKALGLYPADAEGGGWLRRAQVLGRIHLRPEQPLGARPLRRHRRAGA